MKTKFALTFYVIIVGLPLLLGFGYSLLYSFGFIGLMNDGFTLHHWSRLWQNNNAIQSLGFSLYIAFGTLVLMLLPALVFSYWLTFREKSILFYKSLFVPLFFAPIIAAFVGFYLLSPAGIISRMASALGIISDLNDFPRLVNDTYSIGIFVVHIFLIFPLFTLLFVTVAKKERLQELSEISQTLGASGKDFVFKIYVPLLLKKTSLFIMLYGLFIFGAYEVPLILGRQSPRMVSIFITEKMTKFNLNDIAVGHAMTIVYTLFVITVISIFLKKKTNLNPF